MNCEGCGACCDGSYHVEVLDRECLDEELTVPDDEMYDLMRMGCREDGACIALTGTIGIDARCSIYAIRPRPCHLYAVGSQDCLERRAEHKLEKK